MSVLDREPDSRLPLAQQFRFDAGSPGLNLLATLGFRGSAEPVERLTSPDRLRDWLAANDLPPVPVDDGALERVRHLREAAYATLAPSVGPARPSRAAVQVLGEWAARPLPGRGLWLRDGAIGWDDPPASIDTVIGGLARELASLAVDRPAELRRCDADTCMMVYLDRSRGHRRRWCSMRRCGNSAKAARHRVRTTADPR
jgi:predicted RNA-binding Zn ribbon-like protein